MSHPPRGHDIRAEQQGIVRATIDIAAPVEDVFRALADPQELAAWLGANAPARERRGDALHAHAGTSWCASVLAPDGTPGVVRGEYGYVAPPHFLESAWEASWNHYERERVSFSLARIEVGGMACTRVTVTHTRATGLRATTSTLSRPNDVSAAGAWPSLLARLAAHVVTACAPARWGASHAGAQSDWFDALHRAVVDTHHAH